MKGDDFDIRSIGGFWAMLEFKHKEALKNFLAGDVVDHWIAEKVPWYRNFVPPERLDWVDVERLPLHAWSKEAFRKILNNGTIVHLDDGLGEVEYKKIICVLNTTQKIISEALKVSVCNIPKIKM